MRTNRPGQSTLLLLDAVALLARENVGYAVIGAMAAAIHGAVRASLDADVVLPIAPRELEGLENEFKAAGFRTELRRGDLEDPVPSVLELSDRYGNRVDLLAGIHGLEAAAFSRAIDVPFQGEVLRFIGREDFIAMKMFAGGPQDIADASRAIAAAPETLDTNLLRRLTRKYGSAAFDLLEQLLSS